MSFVVKISNTAKNDLYNIFKYIAEEKQSSQNASGQITRLEDGINSLEIMPERNILYNKEPWKSRNTRKLFVDNYIVFYTVDNANKEVNILRVMYAKRNIDKQMK